MIDATKEIIVALINTKQIANTGDTDSNIIEVTKAIEEVYNKLKSCKYE